MTAAPYHVVDCYAGSGPADWQRVRAAGYVAAIIKTSEGATEQDALAVEHVRGARAAGLAVGVYHFVTAHRSAADQARNFLAQIAAVGPLDIVPCLDVEEDASGAYPSASLVCELVQRIHDATGVWSMVYTAGWVIAKIGAHGLTLLRNCPLWDASYTHAEPPPCAPWSDAPAIAWTGWQCAGGVVVDGFARPVDVSVFRVLPRWQKDEAPGEPPQGLAAGPSPAPRGPSPQIDGAADASPRGPLQDAPAPPAAQEGGPEIVAACDGAPTGETL